MISLILLLPLFVYLKEQLFRTNCYLCCNGGKELISMKFFSSRFQSKVSEKFSMQLWLHTS